MLKGTSHRPDEVVGKMAAHTAMGGADNVEVFEHWSYTVKTVAINAVMAGCKTRIHARCCLPWHPQAKRPFRCRTTPLPKV